MEYNPYIVHSHIPYKPLVWGVGGGCASILFAAKWEALRGWDGMACE